MKAKDQAQDRDRTPQERSAVAAMEQRVIVRDLIVLSNIGVSTEERSQPQRIRLNLEVETEPRVPLSDKIVEVVNYGPMVGRVRQICTDCTARLLETLAAEVAQTCFIDERVRVVSLRIEKLDRYPDVGGVGVEVVYRRGDI